MRPFLLLVAFLPAAFQAGGARSQPRCTPAREGKVACLDGKLCTCHHDPGGTLTGRSAGTRWDCGALLPSCGAPAPADVARPPTAEQTPPLPFFPPPYPPPAAWR